ncbi:MAG: NAD-dependent epimerase/dehydratase family protein [Lachnospiraceae bacterium]|nr:NAD-dependent epimerase/dehydratase family protein [Lachnospiraceae bacterium]
MNILVVGGTRFFGIPMVSKLITDGHDVTVATRGQHRDPFEGKCRHIVMDRDDPESVKKALDKYEFDTVIDKISYCSNDVKNLLQNLSCKKYIQMSSCAVYREAKTGIKEEDFDTASYELKWEGRSGDYPEGKRQAERAALEFVDASKCLFVRYPVVMGEHDHTGRIEFYVNHITGGIPMYVDNMDVRMPFIHEKEAGEFIAHLAGLDVTGAVNGSSEGSITMRQFIGYIENKTGKKAVFDNKGEAAPYNGTLADVSYDTTKAEKTDFKFSAVDEWIYGLLDRKVTEGPSL